MNSQKQNNSDCPTCRIQDALSILQRLHLFKEMPLELLKLCAYLSKEEHFQAGEPILLQGDASDRFAVILDGEVDICEEHRGRNYLVQRLTSGEFNYFGELALLGKFEWFFSAWAHSEVTLLTISREAFQKVCERSPEHYPASVEHIVRLRINRFTDQMERLFAHGDQPGWEECGHR